MDGPEKETCASNFCAWQCGGTRDKGREALRSEIVVPRNLVSHTVWRTVGRVVLVEAASILAGL